MKRFHLTLSTTLIGLIITSIIFKTYLFGGKHLFPYFAIGILILELSVLFIFGKHKRKRILQSGLIYLLGYIIIMSGLFKIFHWPNHDQEIISTPESYISYNWKTEKPSSLDFNTEELSHVLEKATSINQIRSVLIVKDKKLVVEKYYHGSSVNNAFNLFLMTQPLVSSLIGIAIDEDFIDNTNQKVFEFFPEYKSKSYVSDKTDLTIEHLLTNRAGLGGDQNERSFKSLNWTKSTLERPRLDKSGKFKLQQQTAHLLSGIITQASGMNTLDFAEQYLCNPLGIKIIDWFQSPEGIYRGSNAIYLTSRDLARYGNLYLSGGRADGKQIIPESWINQSYNEPLKFKMALNDNFMISGIRYSWLTGTIHNHDVHFATDLRGQFIINIPGKDITLITTTYKLDDYQLMESLVCDIIATII